MRSREKKNKAGYCGNSVLTGAPALHIISLVRLLNYIVLLIFPVLIRHDLEIKTDQRHLHFLIPLI